MAGCKNQGFLTPRVAAAPEWNKAASGSQEPSSTSGDSASSSHRKTAPQVAAVSVVKDWSRGLARTREFNRSLHNGALKPRVVSKFAPKEVPKVAVRRMRGSIDRGSDTKKLQPIETNLRKKKSIINLKSRIVFQ